MKNVGEFLTPEQAPQLSRPLKVVERFEGKNATTVVVDMGYKSDPIHEVYVYECGRYGPRWLREAQGSPEQARAIAMREAKVTEAHKSSLDFGH